MQNQTTIQKDRLIVVNEYCLGVQRGESVKGSFQILATNSNSTVARSGDVGHLRIGDRVRLANRCDFIRLNVSHEGFFTDEYVYDHNIPETIYTFWRENRIDQKFEFLLDDIQPKFCWYLDRKGKAWCERYGDQAVVCFVGEDIGLNSVTEDSVYKALAEALKPAFDQHLKSMKS